MRSGESKAMRGKWARGFRLASGPQASGPVAPFSGRRRAARTLRATEGRGWLPVLAPADAPPVMAPLAHHAGVAMTAPVLPAAVAAAVSAAPLIAAMITLIAAAVIAALVAAVGLRRRCRAGEHGKGHRPNE